MIYLSTRQEGSGNGKEAVKRRKLKVHMGFSVILERLKLLPSSPPPVNSNSRIPKGITEILSAVREVSNPSLIKQLRLLLKIILNCCKYKEYYFLHWEERTICKLINYIYGSNFKIVICFK